MNVRNCSARPLHAAARALAIRGMGTTSAGRNDVPLTSAVIVMESPSFTKLFVCGSVLLVMRTLATVGAAESTTI